jgi:hypothetical protein
MSGLSEVYNLSNKIDTHIVSNLEWGATLYLSHSKYGVCSNGSCLEIIPNDSYVSENGKQDTTTRNVYGVYDMAGATPEYAIGDYTIGTAIEEVRLSESLTWYNGKYLEITNDYILRGGFDRGLFATSDISMDNVSTRCVFVNK